MTAGALAQTTTSVTYVGDDQGNWSDPNNWSPSRVPNNTARDRFNVRTADLTVSLDVDATVDSLKLVGDFPTLFAIDHNLASASTRVAGNATNGTFGGTLFFVAQHKNVLANLGNLADFSGTTLTGGYGYLLDTTAADPGVTATYQFNGANIVNSHGGIGMAGPRTQIVDEHGHDALRNFNHNEWDGFFGVVDGHGNFTTSASFLNDGELQIGDGSSITIRRDYTSSDTAETAIFSSGEGDAGMLINGNLGNYDPKTKTLSSTTLTFISSLGQSGTMKVLGSPAIDVVTSNAFINLAGANSGLRDRNGSDALRDLTTSYGMRLGSRSFTTAGAFIVTHRLSLYGDAHLKVTGHLGINGGFLELTPRNIYRIIANDSFPIDPAVMPLSLTVKANFNLKSPAVLRVRFADSQNVGTFRVGGSAVLSGALEPLLLPGATIDSTTRWTILTAKNVVGAFSNVASGQRIDLPSGEGSMLLTITKTAVVLSDFQPAP
jgi:hypothetical protein